MSITLGAVALLAAAKKSSSSSASLLILLLVIGVALYFLFLRPQQQKARKARAAKSEVEIGDEIVTVGGMVGTVVDKEGDRVTVETGGPEGTRLVFVSNAIARKVEPAQPVAEDEDEDTDEADDDVEDHEVEDHDELGAAAEGNGAASSAPGNGAVSAESANDTTESDAGGNGSSNRRRRGRNGTRRTP